MNGPVEVPNGGLRGGHEAQTSGVGVTTNLLREEIDADSNISTVVPKGAAFDSSQNPAIGAVKGEAQIQQMLSESNEPTPFDRGQGTTESITCSPLNVHDSHILNEPRTSLPMTEKVASGHSNVAPPKILGQCPPAEKVQPPASVSVVRSCSPQGVDEATSKIEKLKFCDGQHVIIPSHIQVPDDVKNMLSFGSFRVREKHSNTENNEESNSAADKVHDETTSKSSSCEEEAMPADREGKHVDQPQVPVHILERNSPSEPQVSSSATVVSMKEDNLAAAVGPPFPVVEGAPSYSFGFMPPLLVDPLVVKPDMFEFQPHVSNSQAGVSLTMTNSSSTPPPPPPVQCAGAGQNSVAPSPASIALLRQSYPPTNYVPYSHYYSPFYPPPPYFGHPAFPTTTTILAPANMYLPPPPGMKLSPAAYKPPGGAAANTGNQPPVGLPSAAYAAPYNHHPAHLTFNPTAASGNSIGTEDTVPSLLKENSSYVGQQSEGSTMWVSSAGRDAGSFPLGAYVNLASPGQHLMSHQTGPSAYVYHGVQPPPPPPMATPAPLQHSRPMTGSVESVGPPSS